VLVIDDSLLREKKPCWPSEIRQTSLAGMSVQKQVGWIWRPLPKLDSLALAMAPLWTMGTWSNFTLSFSRLTGLCASIYLVFPVLPTHSDL
jgi:hypothetical protein